jgi:HTH-type transcriptional regulator/antitoxin HigA
MDIRLIGTDADYEEALAEIERLWGAEAGSADEAKLELLAMLVHNYERSREPLPRLDPVSAIKFRMEQQGITRKDLLQVFGTTARVSEVLGGKRALTLDMIRKLHALYAIPLESLIGQAPAPKRRSRRAIRPRRSHHPRSEATRTGGRVAG